MAVTLTVKNEAAIKNHNDAHSRSFAIAHFMPWSPSLMCRYPTKGRDLSYTAGGIAVRHLVVRS